MSHVGSLWPSGGDLGYCVLRRPCHVQGPCPALQGFSLVNSFDKLYRILIFLAHPPGSLGSLFIGFSTGRVPFTLPYLLCLSISMNDYSTYMLLTL